MEDKRITEQESLQIISEMIQNTRRRIQIGDGNIFLYWGALSLGVWAIVYLAVILTGSPSANSLWALTALGFVFNKKLKHPEIMAKSYVDNVSASVWKGVGIIALILAVITLCIGFFSQSGSYSNPFILFYFYPFFFVGFGVMTQGILLNVKPLVFGGILGVAIGSVILAQLLCGELPQYNIMMIALAIGFVVMLVIPGIVLRIKAKSQK